MLVRYLNSKFTLLLVKIRTLVESIDRMPIASGSIGDGDEIIDEKE